MSNFFPSHLGRYMHSISPRNDISDDMKLQHGIQTLQCYKENHTSARMPICHGTPRGHVVACQDCGKMFTCDESPMLCMGKLFIASPNINAVPVRGRLTEMIVFKETNASCSRAMSYGDYQSTMIWDIDPLSGENKTIWRCRRSFPKKTSGFTLSMWWSTDTSIVSFENTWWLTSLLIADAITLLQHLIFCLFVLTWICCTPLLR